MIRFRDLFICVKHFGTRQDISSENHAFCVISMPVIEIVYFNFINTYGVFR